MSLWVLAWPIFLEMLLQFALGAADTLMVSRISDDAVAVVGIANQLFNAVNILFMSIANGAGILIAQKLGAGRLDEARTTGMISLKVCTAIGFAVSVLLVAGAGPITRMLQMPEELWPLGETYIATVGGGMTFLAIMSALSAVVRNTGNTRSPMMVGVGINVLHVLMNYVVIYGALGVPQLGLQGVAWSTTISRIIGALLLLYMFRHAFSVRYELRDLRLFDRGLFRETVKLSWPLGVHMSCWCFTQLVLFAMVASLGAAELSARTYMNTLESFCFTIGSAIATAGQIRIAHLYGAGQWKLAYKDSYRVLWIGLAFVQANALLLYGFGGPVLGLFTSDSNIVSIGVSLLALNLLLQPSKMLNMALNSALTGVGDTRSIMWVGIPSMWAVSVGLSFALGFGAGWGLAGIYTAMIVDECVRGFLLLLRWRFHRKRLTGEQPPQPDLQPRTAAYTI
ncbi:MATE family efflux transporter [Paenibacillus thermoaerophilus]|nr:MATE family efflux transporter [Paenibacillus thermoaerophilus]